MTPPSPGGTPRRDPYEAWYRTLVEHAPVGVMRTTPEGRLVSVNPALVRILGFDSADEILALDVTNDLYVDPADRARVLAQYGDAEFVAVEATWKRKDGTPIALRMRGRAIRGVGRRPEAYDVFVEDASVWETSEARFRALIENSSLVITVIQVDGTLEFVSQGALEILGYQPDEMVGRTCFDWVHPDDVERARAEFAERVAQPGGRLTVEVRLRCKDGSWRDVEGVATNHLATPGLVGIVLTFRDVTERRRAEHLQRAVLKIAEAANTSASLHDLLRAIHETVSELMPARNFYFALRDASTGLLTFPYWVDEFDPPPQPSRPTRGLTEYVLRTGVPLLAKPETYPELARRGEVKEIGTPSLDWLGVPLRIGDTTIGVVVTQTYTEGIRYSEREKIILQFVSTQIASAIERQRAEDALRESEERYRRLVESSPDAVLVYANGTARYGNPALARLLGAESAEALVGRDVLGFVPPEHHERVERRTRRILEQDGPSPPGELRLRHSDGSIIDVEAVAIPVRHGGERAVQVMMRDITERKRAEAQLRLLAQAVKSTHENISIADLEGHFTFVNQAFLDGYGYSASEILGHAVDLIDSPRNPPGLQREIAEATAGGGWNGELWNRRKDGSEFKIALSTSQVVDPEGRVIGLMGVWNDITLRTNLEEQLRQAQKMEAVGQLAGGVAHDFNNLLTAILGFSALLLDGDRVPHAERRDVEEIHNAAERAAALTHQLLAFSRQQVLSPVELDLNSVVGDIETMLRRVIGEHIQLSVARAGDLGLVKADRSQVEQVIINFAVNARDAMPNGGSLTIETANVSLDAAAESLGGVTPGAYVVLAVSDTGVGMDAATRSRIFEPFFTTKELGAGTGLGLATVYGIVQQSGGHLTVSSELGQGSTFRVFLPRLLSSVGAATGRTQSSAPARGTETVLVVEDEPSVRELATKTLGMFGYRVLEADGGPQALALARSHPEAIDLLFTDVVMPSMSGRELAEQLARARPALRVLYSSGYTDGAIVHHGVLEDGVAFLPKPYTPKALARKVREVLDGAGSAGSGSTGP